MDENGEIAADGTNPLNDSTEKDGDMNYSELMAGNTGGKRRGGKGGAGKRKEERGGF